MPAVPPSPRTTVRRRRERGAYDRELVAAILDEALICHVGVIVEGSPVVLPTIHARVGDTLYLHGAPANAVLGAAGGAEVCVTATLVDGLVLARSAFHHSVNYRSVVVFGAASSVVDPAEKRRALAALVEHVVAGRTGGTRDPSEEEVRSTQVVALPLAEASAKVRTGPPIEDEADLGLPVWAGVVPLTVVAGEPEPDPHLPPGTPVPDHVRTAGRRSGLPTAEERA